VENKDGEKEPYEHVCRGRVALSPAGPEGRHYFRFL